MLLATLAVQDLNYQALVTAPNANQPQNKAGNIVIPHSTEDAAIKKATPESMRAAIASPESLVGQEFAQPASDTSKVPNTQPTEKLVVSAVETTANKVSYTDITSPKTSLQATSANTLAVQSRSAQDLQQVSTLAQNVPTESCQNVAQRELEFVAPGVQKTPQPCLEVDNLKSRLRAVEDIKPVTGFQASPALSIAIPTGYGADKNTAFLSGTYQNRTRYTNVSDGGLGVGVGLGDAQKAVGVELSYTLASFGSSRDIGTGGFNVKVHKQLPNDFAVAAGYNGFLNVGGANDFENSVYGTVTKVFRTREDINSPLSRVAVTAGVGTGQFRSESSVNKDSGGVGVFGNVALRVAQPVSVIAEWSGQDLGVGVSVAPFKNIPLVITPAVRDIVGAGNGPRFVLGAGVGFKF